MQNLLRIAKNKIELEYIVFHVTIVKNQYVGLTTKWISPEQKSISYQEENKHCNFAMPDMETTTIVNEEIQSYQVTWIAKLRLHNMTCPTDNDSFHVWSARKE